MTTLSVSTSCTATTDLQRRHQASEIRRLTNEQDLRHEATHHSSHDLKYHNGKIPRTDTQGLPKESYDNRSPGDSQY